MSYIAVLTQLAITNRENLYRARAAITKPEDNEPLATIYTKQNICDHTLDDAQLAIRCPLDNGGHINASSSPRYPAGRLDQLPAELLTQVLLWLDLPSLTDFRRVNRRTMELVDSIPQYDAIVKHCPNILRAVISLQANAFSCGQLYATLGTTQCSTCEHYGDHLYLIDCRRVCYPCFAVRQDYFPLTIGRATAFFHPEQRKPTTARQRLQAADIPSVLSLPGRYCTSRDNEGGTLVRKRLRLFDRRGIVGDRDMAGAPSVPKIDKTIREPQRFMAIITAPYLFDAGRQADWGHFCAGCRDSNDWKGKHFRYRYTEAGMVEHVARYGVVEESSRVPGMMRHVMPV
ncbi:Nucleic-acid-binding protein from mobile element jockey [Sphaceloma murrayae]|uniref:Nucleic-acid-binding protein from mobile element jockey n=1 Tax=Sphaceloma murrayae TaxID=2082308 RepID=A0A2K1QXD1_9PEZI|nr:Nucleic-acid-binding protein from mobile element jockey [Sphaceloma murrayae]